MTNLSTPPQEIDNRYIFIGTPEIKTLYVRKGYRSVYEESDWAMYFSTITDDIPTEPVTPIVGEGTVDNQQFGSLISFQMNIQQGVIFAIGANMKAKIYADNKLIGEANLNDVTLINGILTIKFHSVTEKSMAKMMAETINEATATELVDVRVDIEANSFSVDGTPYPYTMSFKYKAPAEIEDVFITDSDSDKIDPTKNVVISIAKAGYSTFYDSKNAYILPNGVVAYVASEVNNGKIILQSIADGSGNNNILTKGVAVMLSNSAKTGGTYTLTYTDKSASYSGANYLHGSDVATTTTASGSNKYYKLTYGSNTDTKDVFGWYWGDANGGAFKIEGHKAWLAIPSNLASKSMAFVIDGEETGIMLGVDAVTSSDAPCFTLTGMPIVDIDSYKGVYIQNGMKMAK